MTYPNQTLELHHPDCRLTLPCRVTTISVLHTVSPYEHTAHTFYAFKE